MDRAKIIQDHPDLKAFFHQLNQSNFVFGKEMQNQFNRSLPFCDLIFDRWDRAKALGFQEGTSIYDSSLVLGDVKIGKKVWIGPFTIIDGSGGLTIGDFTTISAGVHIYTHDNIKSTLSGGTTPIERTPVSIGNKSYIGPNCVVSRGVNIGNQCLIGCNSFVNIDIPDNAIAVGNPCKIIGEVVDSNNKITFNYLKE